MAVMNDRLDLAMRIERDREPEAPAAILEDRAASQLRALGADKTTEDALGRRVASLRNRHVTAVKERLQGEFRTRSAAQMQAASDEIRRRDPSAKHHIVVAAAQKLMAKRCPELLTTPSDVLLREQAVNELARTRPWLFMSQSATATARGVAREKGTPANPPTVAAARRFAKRALESRKVALRGRKSISRADQRTALADAIDDAFNDANCPLGVLNHVLGEPDTPLDKPVRPAEALAAMVIDLPGEAARERVLSEIVRSAMIHPGDTRPMVQDYRVAAALAPITKSVKRHLSSD